MFQVCVCVVCITNLACHNKHVHRLHFMLLNKASRQGDIHIGNMCPLLKLILVNQIIIVIANLAILNIILNLFSLSDKKTSSKHLC